MFFLSKKKPPRFPRKIIFEVESSGTFRENEDVSNVSMDNNQIERERGITILAKTTAINYKDYRINIKASGFNGRFALT